MRRTARILGLGTMMGREAAISRAIDNPICQEQRRMDATSSQVGGIKRRSYIPHVDRDIGIPGKGYMKAAQAGNQWLRTDLIDTETSAQHTQVGSGVRAGYRLCPSRLNA
jgi:hypothetical protein